MNEMNILFDIKNTEEEFKEIEISVENKLEDNLNYKFLIGFEGTWTTLKELSETSHVLWRPEEMGKYSIMVQAKRKESKKPFDFISKTDYVVGEVEDELVDDFYIDKTEVTVGKPLEIIKFKSLTKDLLEGRELVFEVEATHDDSEMVLYKFIKINPDGSNICVQDYSTKKLVSYVEAKKGQYKLLCIARELHSLNEFDDRALIHYRVDPYEDIKIHSFTSDLSSPQSCDTPIIFKCIAKGGKELLYKFKVHGNRVEDSGYIKADSYQWTPKEAGKYKIHLWVKDTSFQGEYEREDSLDFVVEDISCEKVVIEDIILDKTGPILKGEVINIKVKASGGNSLRYSFTVFKDNKEIERIKFGIHDFVNFTPESSGRFRLEIRVTDKYSKREFDCCEVIYIEAMECIPAEIDYSLLPKKDYYMVGETISIDVIAGNTQDILIDYILKINGHLVEQTNFVEYKKYELKPKCSGNYLVELRAKNRLSSKEYDTKKQVEIEIEDTLPVTKTKILCDNAKLLVNEAITFITESQGGMGVIYEFYLMEKDKWNLVQKYSRKNDYSFMPFTKGIYKILVLSKSFYKSILYEDYAIMEVKVIE